MIKRPLLLILSALAFMIWMLQAAGAPVFGEPKLTARQKKLLDSGNSVRITGRIAESRETSGSCRYVLESVRIHSGEPFGLPRLLVTTKKQYELMLPGCTVSIRGDVKRIEAPGNPGEFDQQAYYARSGIFYSLWCERIDRWKPGVSAAGGMQQVRREIALRTEKILGDADAGILNSMVLGERGLLLPEVRSDFQNGGLMHLLAISGLHIARLGGALFFLLQFAGVPLAGASAFSSGAMILYAVFTGASFSAVRAVIMFAVQMTAGVMKKSYDRLNALSLAGILLLLSNPACLSDGGFLLSFSAVIAITILYPVLRDLLPDGFWKKRRFGTRPLTVLVHGIVRGILSWLSVFLVTLPVLMSFFYEIPVYAVLINLVFMPPAGWILSIGFAGCLISLISVPAASAVLAGPGLYFRILRMALRLVGSIPGAVFVTGVPSKPAVGFYYLILAGFVFVRSRRNSSGAGGKAAKDLLLPAAACLILLIRPVPEFSLTMLDVGQGDSLVIQSGNGKNFLVDCGSSTDEKRIFQDRVGPYLKHEGIRRLDGILVSHPDADHVNGIIELLEQQAEGNREIKTNAVFLPFWMKENGGREGSKIKMLCRRAGIPVRYVSRGAGIKAGHMDLRVLHPVSGGRAAEGNAGSMVVELRKEGFRALLTGDLEKEGEDEVIPELERCQYLKVAHHGSRYSTGDDFLKKVRPRISTVSAPAHSRYGHPHPETVRRLKQAGSDVFVTRDCGAIRVSLKEGKIRLRCRKK